MPFAIGNFRATQRARMLTYHFRYAYASGYVWHILLSLLQLGISFFPSLLGMNIGRRQTIGFLDAYYGIRKYSWLLVGRHLSASLYASKASSCVSPAGQRPILDRFRVFVADFLSVLFVGQPLTAYPLNPTGLILLWVSLAYSALQIPPQ